MLGEHGITRIDENCYDITIRSDHRRDYKTHPRPGIFNLRSENWWKGGKMPKRDANRQKCYDAENAARKLFTDQMAFDTIREMATWFRNIMESDWFQRRFPHFYKLRIRYKPGMRGAWAWVTQHNVTTNTNNPEFMQHAVTGKIEFSRWAQGISGENGGSVIMLHELAHCILPSRHHHDRRWARVFLELVRHFISDNYAAILEAQFKARKVKYKPCRVLTDAQRQAASQRAKARFAGVVRRIPVAA
jgi:hypothetical protein